MSTMTMWPQTSTSNAAEVVTMFWCASHTIRRMHAKGSNQHKRIEYGECTLCGKPFRRVISWNEKDARSWWEPTP